MRPASACRDAVLALALALALHACAATRPASVPTGLPPIVFVSRRPITGERAIPGLGPHHRAAAPGGRLMVREPDGRVRALLVPGRLHDAADPAPSPDGRWIAFAGITHPDSGWRIFVAALDGTGLRHVTRSDRTRVPGSSTDRDDDLDPCWLGDSLLVFASTRGGERAAYANVPVTNLWLVRLDRTRRTRLTFERNGAEEPAFDPQHGGLVYARWWFNPFRPSASDASGITTDPGAALPGDSVNVWHAIRLGPGPDEVRLAAGQLRTRAGRALHGPGAMAYQPAWLGGDAWLGVYATNLGLSPRPGGTGIQLFRGFRDAHRLVGAIASERGGDAYGEARGLTPASACAPARLPDGRIVFAHDAGGRGDFGLAVMRRDGTGRATLLDLPGTLELDPAPVVLRRRSRAAPAWIARGGGLDAPLDPAALRAPPPARTFTYHVRDVFHRGRAAAPGEAPARQPGVSIRFFAALPTAHGDTAVLVREMPVGRGGEVRAEGLPSEVAMFEQLVGADGRPLRSAHAVAHVAGMNFGRAGSTRRCAGCHLGHSIER